MAIASASSPMDEAPTLRQGCEPTLAPGQQGKTLGDQAINDAVIVVIGAWALLWLLGLSLRKHSL